jgi:hypothetical protein
MEQPLGNGTYYWRSFADDGLERSVLTPVTRFSVDVALPGLPAEVFLYSPSPNPVVEDVTVRFELPARVAAKLGLYDLAGREVVTLVDGLRGAGLHEFSWNGKDYQETRIPNGMYILKLDTRGSQRLRKLVVLR